MTVTLFVIDTQMGFFDFRRWPPMEGLTQYFIVSVGISCIEGMQYKTVTRVKQINFRSLTFNDTILDA